MFWGGEGTGHSRLCAPLWSFLDTRGSRNGMYHLLFTVYGHNNTGRAIPVQVWVGTEVSRRLRLPDFKIFGIRPPLPPQEIFLVLISLRD